MYDIWWKMIYQQVSMDMIKHILLCTYLSTYVTFGNVLDLAETAFC